MDYIAIGLDIHVDIYPCGECGDVEICGECEGITYPDIRVRESGSNFIWGMGVISYFHMGKPL